MKDATVDRRVQGIEVARALGYGVTGNFVIDPAWGEADFERLWGFVERHRLFQAGFTILTPLPGTAYFDEMRPTLEARRWAQFDMHHLLWEPRARPAALLRALLRNVAAVGPQPQGPQRRCCNGCARSIFERAVPDARAQAARSADGRRSLHEGIRPGAVR